MTAAYPDSARAPGSLDPGAARCAQPASIPPGRRRFLLEEESDASGSPVPIATVFLTNRECPWRCLMCDLWQNTLPGETPESPAVRSCGQIRSALAALPAARWIKLYNGGSFFDPRAMPPGEDPRDRAGAGALRARHRGVASGAGRRALRRAREAPPRPARGRHGTRDDPPRRAAPLEQAHDARRTSAGAADFLRARGIALRAFVLVGLPWVEPSDAVDWAVRSADFAFDCGARAVSLIPTRTGNGAMEALEAAGAFVPPTLGAR